VNWLRSYDRSEFPADLVSGLTLAAYAIPVSLAYASLAGLPPHCGIYCYLLGGLGYALLGSSRQLAIGPTSAIAMLVGTTIGGMVEGDARRWAEIAALTALMVAILSGISWQLRLSGLMNFVSETILLGFKAGAALTIVLTQLPKLFGVPGGGDHFFERAWILAGQLPATNPVVFGFGLTAIAILLWGEKQFPGRPVALCVVVLSIIAMSFTALSHSGVAVVGELPPGLPELSIPSLRFRDVDGVLPLACACLILSYIESVSAGKALASKNGYEIDARQELLGIGAANLAVAFFQGFPVAGGLSQSAVNDRAGARSPLSLVFASVTLGLCLLFLTGFLKNLPHVVLAAVLLVAVRGLIDIRGLRRLWRVSRAEFRIAIVALVGVLLLGILKGVLLAAIVSLLMLISAVAHPHVAFLGRIPGTKRFSDLAQHPDNESLPFTMIFRVESSLLYFNCDHVRKIVWNRIQESEGLQVVVCDLSNSAYLDLAGARMLAGLQKDLHERRISLRFVEVRSHMSGFLQAEGLTASECDSLDQLFDDAPRHAGV